MKLNKQFITLLAALAGILPAGAAAYRGVSDAGAGLLAASVEVPGTEVIVGVRKLNPAAVEVLRADGLRMTVDFYGPNIFRAFLDPEGGILRDPAAEPEAQILVDNPRRDVGPVTADETRDAVTIATEAVRVETLDGVRRIAAAVKRDLR